MPARLTILMLVSFTFSCGGPIEEDASASLESALVTEPDGTCTHAVTAVGVALTKTCSQCAANVCAKDSYCCTNSWDSICVSKVKLFCPVVSDSGVVDAGVKPVDGGSKVDAGTGLTCGSVSTPGPKQSASCGACQAKVCGVDPYCCTTSWDSLCVSGAATLCNTSDAGVDGGLKSDAGMTPDAGVAQSDGGATFAVVSNPSFDVPMASCGSSACWVPSTINAQVSQTTISRSGPMALLLSLPKPIGGVLGAPSDVQAMVQQTFTLPAGAKFIDVWFSALWPNDFSQSLSMAVSPVTPTSGVPSALYATATAPTTSTSHSATTWAKLTLNVSVYAGMPVSLTLRAATNRVAFSSTGLQLAWPTMSALADDVVVR